VRVLLEPLASVLLVAVLLVAVRNKVGSYSFGEPSKAHLVEEKERLNRSKDRPFYCHSPVPVREFQEFEQGMDMRGVDHATDTNGPREHVDCPALVRVKAECLL